MPNGDRKERKMEEKKKVCPLMSAPTLMMEQAVLENRAKFTQKIMPVACLGEQCMLFNPKFKSCVFIANAIVLTSMYAKEMGLVKEEEDGRKN